MNVLLNITSEEIFINNIKETIKTDIININILKISYMTLIMFNSMIQLLVSSTAAMTPYGIF